MYYNFMRHGATRKFGNALQFMHFSKPLIKSSKMQIKLPYLNVIKKN